MSGAKSFRIFKIIVIFVLLIAFMGCSKVYKPSQYPLKTGMIPEFRGGQPVNILNVQTNTRKIMLCREGYTNVYGNLHDWTETAVGLLKTELEKRDIVVAEDAPKVLKLAVNKANIYPGFCSMRCILYLKVETGDGYIAEFEGNNLSPWDYKRASSGAMTRAVGAMLNDNKILNYLKE